MNNSVQNLIKKKKKNPWGKKQHRRKNSKERMLIIPFTMFLEVAQGPHDSLDLLSPLITFLSPVPWKCGKKKKSSAEDQKYQRGVQIWRCATDTYFHCGETMKSPRGESV